MGKPSKYLAVVLAERDVEKKYSAIIERAANNGYHDFKFDVVPGHPEYGDCACPKMKLVEDLSAFPELEDIRHDVINGEYDDEGDVEDGERIRQDLLRENAPD